MNEWEEKVRTLLNQKMKREFDIEEWLDKPLRSMGNMTAREMIDSGNGEGLYNHLVETFEFNFRG